MSDQQTSAAIQELLRTGYTAFNARDIDALLSMMHPDVQWANGMEGGYVHGHEGIRAYWTHQWSLIDPFVEPQAFRTEPDGRTVVEVHQRVMDKDGNTLSEGTVEHVYEVRNGLIQRMEIRNPTDDAKFHDQS
jgi:hypothetical protein